MDELKVIVDEAHAMERRVASHAQGIIGCRNAVEAGVETLEHAMHLDDELIEEILKKDISITMTMSVGRYAREAGIKTSYSYLPKLLDGRPSGEVSMESRKKAMEAGVNIAMGTDCGHLFPPGKNAYELDVYVRVLSMSPMDAILTATKNSAKALGRLNDLGTIEKGKIADIIIVDGNPLKDIKVLQDLNRIKVVMKEGKIEVDRR
jgi:imidazolonepropionase-like amidohydrolase